ncbi:autotransporter family protein [Pseudomonas sp. SST3]|uniref:autotransporter family protein n=1 Tax=Pseudomonas sp. SST3 TaxID=2267882 RepID=UPI001F50773D|nr:autotransporter outer membrane beta-barrel domain-containing protein [Pseudomonas sp. SST3]
MNPAAFRKTLLAIAVAGAAFPIYAQTLVLDDSGLLRQDVTFIEPVTVNGSFTSVNSEEDAIEFNGVTFENDLIIDAEIKANGDFADGVDLSELDSQDVMQATEIFGDFVNQGEITVTGGGVTGMIVDPAIVHGSLVNAGTLSASGAPLDGESVRALEISGQSEIHQDVVNAATGKIVATGENATAVLLMGSEIDGRLINNGLIQVAGMGADAIDVTTNEQPENNWSKRASVSAIENHGSIIANGVDADGIQIDGGVIDSIVNTGTIEADSTAIVIGDFEVSNAREQEQEYYLKIHQQGGLISGQDAAINAEGGKVDLEWSGGKIQGDILGLDGYVQITNSVEFDGALIEIGNDETVRVGVNTSASKEATFGHLELLGTHTTIDGDLVVAQNSSLGLNLSNATDTAKPVLTVAKSAEFGQGAKVILQANDADFSANGSSYKLVSAQEIIDKGLQVVSSNQLLKVSDLKITSTGIAGGLSPVDGGPSTPPVDGGDDTQNPPTDGGETPTTPPSDGGQTGVIDVISKTPEEFKETIATGGGSQNAQAASVAFSQIASKLPKRLQAAFDGNATEAARLVEQTTPEANGGATQAATSGQTLVSNVTGNRTSSIRGMSSGDALQETGVWVQALYSDANQDLRDGVAGYNAYSRGIAIGADGKLNDQLTLGVAYSFLNTDVNSENGNETEVDGHAFTLYSGYELGRYFVDASLTYGINSNEGTRYVLGENAKSDYDSSVLGLNVTSGYSYSINDNLVLEPRLAARYSRIDIDSYREKNATLALAIEDQRYEVIELGAGLRVAAQYPLGRGTLEPQAKLMAYHDFAADQASSTSAFVLGGTPFVTSGAKPARNSYEAGIGADYRLGQFTIGLGYDYVGKSDFNADTFTAKVRYDF